MKKPPGPYQGWLGGKGKRSKSADRELRRDESGNFVVVIKKLSPPELEQPDPTTEPESPKLPSQFAAEAFDDTYPHKTAEHWLWLMVWTLVQRHRKLQGLPCPAIPNQSYAAEQRKLDNDSAGVAA